MKCAPMIVAIAGLATALPNALLAQDDPAPQLFNDFVNISVDLNLTHLEATVGAVIVSCELHSFFNTTTANNSFPETVGIAHYVIHGGMFERNGRPPDFVPLTTFERVDLVFGNGANRQINRTIDMLVGPTHSPSRMEEWSTGACLLELLHVNDGFDPTQEEVLGELPKTCEADSPTRLYNCVRPGTDPDDAIFTFNREF